MEPSRFSLALETGDIRLPETGVIGVFGAIAGDDLSLLPQQRVHVVQGFRPDHDALSARGYRVSVAAEGPYSGAIVCLPRARAAGQARIAEAVRTVVAGGPIIIDGQKTDGIDAMLRAVRARAPLAMGPVPKAHGKIFAVAASPGLFDDWQARPRVTPEGHETLPGVFSADGIDPGSALLAGHLPQSMAGRAADLGAGWGYLSLAVLGRGGVQEMHLVEADHDALACARRNVRDPRAVFHWADAVGFRPGHAFDWIVCNPPFHSGRAVDPGVGLAFIRAAAAMLAPSGRVLVVANRHLPYERVLGECFGNVAVTVETGPYKVFEASRPLASGKARVRQRRR